MLLLCLSIYGRNEGVETESMCTDSSERRVGPIYLRMRGPSPTKSYKNVRIYMYIVNESSAIYHSLSKCQHSYSFSLKHILHRISTHSSCHAPRVCSIGYGPWRMSLLGLNTSPCIGLDEISGAVGFNPNRIIGLHVRDTEIHIDRGNLKQVNMFL